VVPPDWETDPDHPAYSIYQVLVQDAQQSAITVSIGSVVGSLVLLKVIDYVPRKTFMVWSFLALAALLAITGGSLFGVFRTNEHAVTIVFYALSQFVFNLGPNTLTFIIPAEIFPTRYRATCHGLSAASGKLGSIIIQVILLRLTPTGINITNSGRPKNNILAIILVVFSLLMALGALFAWLWLPEMQHHQRIKGWKLPSKTLEDLGRGRSGAEQDRVRNRSATEERLTGQATNGHRGKLRWRRQQREEGCTS
jgi:MFS transporter, PHS family, inorganic phosphate transporter